MKMDEYKTVKMGLVNIIKDVHKAEVLDKIISSVKRVTNIVAKAYIPDLI